MVKFQYTSKRLLSGYYPRSRSEYIKAMTHFKKMAEHHKNSYEALKSISDEIEKLEAIIVQPFMP